MNIPTQAQIFVTGGTGFLGRSLLRILNPSVRRQHCIGLTILTREPDRFRKHYADLASGVEFVQGDVRNFSWPTGHFSHVIHAATDVNVRAAFRAGELVSTIVEGTARVLDFAKKTGADKMLYVSSGAVYGRQPPDLEVVPEQFLGAPDPADPASAYGNAKRMAEQLCTIAAQSGLAVKVARLFAFVGEDLPLDEHFAIGNFIRDAIERKTIAIKGDGSPVRSYLYQADLVSWLIEILERGVPGRPYNVGSEEAISIAQLAHLVADIVAPGLAVMVAKRQADYEGRMRYVPSTQRVRDELGLLPSVTLREAVKLTADWHRHNIA